MYKIDFNRPQWIHFIGIGGISMSGLAEILKDKGFEVSGSDVKDGEQTTHLREMDIQVAIGQKAENIKEGMDAVVYTAAIHKESNEEYQEAERQGIPLISRAELLGQMMKNYKEAIAIAGTHGKTTTTSMVTEIFLAADTDPTVSVGGILHTIGGNIRVGGPEYFVTEACEYTDSFLSFWPDTAVVLNVEEDHLDYFKDIHAIRRSFKRFIDLVPERGIVVINGEIDRFRELAEEAKGRVVTFGSGRENDYSADAITYDSEARPSFDVYIRGESFGRVSLGVEGGHNVYNALAAVAVAVEHGISMDAVRKGLLNFQGTDRRFQKKGVRDGVTIIDDYAHHPSEIQATLRTAREYTDGRIWCVFQPHTYSRTKAFLDEFAEALSLADCVILTDIYPARETDTLGVSSADIADRLKARGVSVWYLPTFEETEKFILKNCIQGELLITMGAGDIVKVGEELLGL